MSFILELSTDIKLKVLYDCNKYVNYASIIYLLTYLYNYTKIS